MKLWRHIGFFVVKKPFRLLGIPDPAQSGLYLIKNYRIIDRGRHLVRFAFRNLCDCAAQDLSRSSLRQAIHNQRLLKCGNRTDLIADQLDAFIDNIRFRSIAARVQTQEPNRVLSFQIISHTDNSAFRNVSM